MPTYQQTFHLRKSTSRGKPRRAGATLWRIWDFGFRIARHDDVGLGSPVAVQRRSIPNPQSPTPNWASPSSRGLDLRVFPFHVVFQDGEELRDDLVPFERHGQPPVDVDRGFGLLEG